MITFHTLRAQFFCNFADMLRIFFILPLFAIISCQTAENDNQSHTSDAQSNNYIASHNATAKLSIEGMTCEIGCVRTVKSHLSKMEGVFEIDMDFDTSRVIDFSTVEFDTNLVSLADMKMEIESIANGIYHITNMDTH